MAESGAHIPQIDITGEAYQDGRFAASVFLQSVHDSVELTSHEEMASAFVEVAVDEILAFQRAADPRDGLARLFGFMGRVGEILWLYEYEQLEQETKLNAAADAGRQVATVISLAMAGAGKEGGKA